MKHDECFGKIPKDLIKYILSFTRCKNAQKYDDNGNCIVPLIIASGGHGACGIGVDYKPYNGIDGLAIYAENRDDFGGYITDGHAARGASFKNDLKTFRSHSDTNDTHFNSFDYNKCNPTCFISENGDQRAIGGSSCNPLMDIFRVDGGFGGGGGVGAGSEGGAGGGYIGGLVVKTDRQEYYTKYKKYGALSYNICDRESKIMRSGKNSGNGKIQIQFVG